jgi:valyl-tRNA synthetase
MDDVEWIEKYHIKPIEIMNPDGTLNEKAGKYQGLSSKKARAAIIADLEQDGRIEKIEPIKHVVQTHERCDTEIEILMTDQWFIKYLDQKDNMLEWGNKLNWYPDHMKNRYDNWVKGLKYDWCISRQRFFGVPIPVWYCKKCSEIILPEEKDLPVDPTESDPSIKQCPKCRSTEFVGEKDVLDTWATSSLTPRLAIELMPKEIQERLYPMSLRPQAHDIITFWLFNTTVKSNLHFKKNPWKDCVISGWALDPQGKKMSKSKGNVVEPQKVIEKYSADILRFWAAGAKLGEDLAFQEKDIQTANKTVVKLWNASKFGFMHLQDYKKEKPTKLEGIDRWLLSKLNDLIKESTENFKRYEYAKVKADVEYFFWHALCDNYLEIVKDRLYNPDKRGKEQRMSAQYALYTALLAINKMFAPIMPFLTEELYQLFFKEFENEKSIHISRWPEYDSAKEDKKAEKEGDIAVAIVSAVRQEKTLNKKSLKEPVKLLTIETKEDLSRFLDDIRAATNSDKIELGKGKTKISEDLSLSVEL